MADLRKWIGGDASCHHTNRNVLAGGLQSCAKCGATGIAGAPALYTQADLDAAVAAERERCANVVESIWPFRTSAEVAAAIRAQKP